MAHRLIGITSHISMELTKALLASPRCPARASSIADRVADIMLEMHARGLLEGMDVRSIKPREENKT